MQKVMKLSSLSKFFLLFFISCQDPVDETVDTSWSIIHKKIFKPNCSNCHMIGSAIEKQSGLDLSSIESHDQLIGISPKNKAAREDGLFIVSSEGGMKGLTQS